MSRCVAVLAVLVALAGACGPAGPLGPEFQVNTYTERPGSPSVATDADGNFVVAWQSHGQDGHRLGVFARFYDRRARRSGPGVQVNTYTPDASSSARGRGGDGWFVVVWTSSARTATRAAVRPPLRRRGGAPGPDSG